MYPRPNRNDWHIKNQIALYNFYGNYVLVQYDMINQATLLSVTYNHLGYYYYNYFFIIIKNVHYYIDTITKTLQGHIT